MKGVIPIPPAMNAMSVSESSYLNCPYGPDKIKSFPIFFLSGKNQDIKVQIYIHNRNHITLCCNFSYTLILLCNERLRQLPKKK